MRNILISSNDGWSNGCWSGLEKRGVVEVVRFFLSNLNPLQKLLFKISASSRLACFGFNVLQDLFVKKAINELKILKDQDVAIIVYHISGGYRLCRLFSKIKRRCPNVKIGYVFTNVISKSLPRKTESIVKTIKATFDKVYAFDRRDAENYGIHYHYLTFNPLFREEPTENIYDAFLVAKAKDRLDRIIDIYTNCINDGIKCVFYVNGVEKKEMKRLAKTSIVVNSWLDYNSVLELINKSKCIIDIMQKGSQGITLNVVESIVFGKKTISDNVALLDEPFFDPSRFYIIGKTAYSLKTFLDTPIQKYTEEEKKLFDGVCLFADLIATESIFERTKPLKR